MLFFDRLRAKPETENQNMHLLITTCMILACKFLERDDNVPLISDIIKVMLNSTFQKQGFRSVTYEQVCSNELHLMANLDWDLY